MDTMIFTLLLICSLTEAQLQQQPDPEINSDVKPAGSHVGAGNPSEHQLTCTQDINAVLREMSASLAGLKVEVKYLQKENEEQAATLKEFELQKAELDNLKQEYQVQSKELMTLKSRTGITEHQVEALTKDAEVKQVAFSASLMASGGADIGPFNAYTSLIFKNVVANIGNAYNSNTGFFTAPVKGAYHFEFHLYAHGHPSHGSGAVLVKNGERIYNAYEHQTSHGANSANSIVLPLEHGDVVYLLLREQTRIFDDQYHYTTFSGHLLFTM